MKDEDEYNLDMGIDDETDRAATQVAKTLDCSGCGLSWEQSVAHWSDWIEVDGKTCLNPRWYCDHCSEAQEQKRVAQAIADEAAGLKH